MVMVTDRDLSGGGSGWEGNFGGRIRWGAKVTCRGFRDCCKVERSWRRKKRSRGNRVFRLATSEQYTLVAV